MSEREALVLIRRMAVAMEECALALNALVGVAEEETVWDEDDRVPDFMKGDNDDAQ